MTGLTEGTQVVVTAARSFVEFPTVVAATDDDQLVLAAPDVSLLHVPQVGEHAVVAWLADGARYELKVRMLGVDETGAWHVLRLASAERIQRRRFFRVPLVHRCRVGADDLVLEGMVLDISEGGALCRVPRTGSLEAGATVQVDLLLDGDPVATFARVVAVTAGAGDAVDLRLEITDRHASDVLRRHVFSFQVRDRALRA